MRKISQKLVSKNFSKSVGNLTEVNVSEDERSNKSKTLSYWNIQSDPLVEKQGQQAVYTSEENELSENELDTTITDTQNEVEGQDEGDDTVFEDLNENRPTSDTESYSRPAGGQLQRKNSRMSRTRPQSLSLHTLPSYIPPPPTAPPPPIPESPPPTDLDGGAAGNSGRFSLDSMPHSSGNEDSSRDHADSSDERR